MELVIEFIIRIFFIALFTAGFSAVCFILFRKIKKILFKQLGVSLAVVSAVLLCLTGYYSMDVIKKDVSEETLSYSHSYYKKFGYYDVYFIKGEEKLMCRAVNSRYNELELNEESRYAVTYAKRTKIIVSAEKLKG